MWILVRESFRFLDDETLARTGAHKEGRRWGTSISFYLSLAYGSF